MSEPSPPDFRMLFESQFSYVWGALRRLGVATPDVEDLTHDVFLDVHRKLREYDASRPIRPWLFGFAYRAASNHRRRAHLRHEIDPVDDSLADPAPSAEEQLVFHEERSVVSEALDALDLERRAILVLHDWDGIPIPDVARELGIPLNTAYSRLRLAREALTAAMKRVIARRGGR